MRKYCKINFIFSKEVCIFFLKKIVIQMVWLPSFKDMLCG